MPRRTGKCGLGVLAVKKMVVGLVMLASIFGLTGPVANAAPKPVPAVGPGLTLPMDRWCGYYQPCWNNHHWRPPYVRYHFWYGWRWYDYGWYDQGGCGCWRP